MFIYIWVCLKIGYPTWNVNIVFSIRTVSFSGVPYVQTIHFLAVNSVIVYITINDYNIYSFALLYYCTLSQPLLIYVVYYSSSNNLHLSVFSAIIFACLPNLGYSEINIFQCLSQIISPNRATSVLNRITTLKSCSIFVNVNSVIHFIISFKTWANLDLHW